METCDRKYMFGDKSTFGQNMHAQKRSTRIFFCKLNKGQFNQLFYCKKVLNFTFPLKICTFFKGIRE